MNDVNKEKRAEIIQDALDYLDDDMLENVDKLRMGTKVPGERGGNLKCFFTCSTRYLAVAASVCLLIVGSFAWENLIGPPDYQNAPKGTESVDDNYREPENTPGLNEDMERGTEEKPGDVDGMNPVESEGVSDGIIVDTELIEVPGDSTQEEPDHYAPLGDAYQLVDNYAKVTMLPNKAWASEKTVKENFANSREIGERYYGSIDKFVDALCDTPRLRTDMVLDIDKPVGDTDVYHIFFQRTDGEIVQVCIFADYGFVYFYGDSEYGMKIKGGLLSEVLTVLWTHW